MLQHSMSHWRAKDHQVVTLHHSQCSRKISYAPHSIQDVSGVLNFLASPVLISACKAVLPSMCLWYAFFRTKFVIGFAYIHAKHKDFISRSLIQLHMQRLPSQMRLFPMSSKFTCGGWRILTGRLFILLEISYGYVKFFISN